MSDITRKYQFNRRNKSIADLGARNMTTGTMTVAQLTASELWKVNSIHNIGIATTTEVGLEPARYPIRVKIGAGTGYTREAQLVCKYWPIALADGNYVTFNPVCPFNDTVLERLYSLSENLDYVLWGVYENAVANRTNVARSPALAALEVKLAPHLQVPLPTDAMRATAMADLNEYFAKCREEAKIAEIPLGGGFKLMGKPHGMVGNNVGVVIADHINALETTLTTMVNFNRMKARYPDLIEGAVANCAYAVANMFQMGFYEQSTGGEYYTVFVNPTSTTSYTVTGINKAPNAPDLTDIPIGTVWDIANVKIDTTISEISSAFVAMSGVMHYSANHTTGGSIMSGPLLSLALSFGWFDVAADNATQEKYTSLFYEALHPTNKRHMANVFFRDAKVWTAGRHRFAPKMMRFSADAFVTIRLNPYPAGAHKAYVAGEVLKRVLAANLAPFLPWAGELNTCVEACAGVIRMGARAHIGSRYYTGQSPNTQGSAIDGYLPDLAMYIQTMAKSDTLAMSPHLSLANAARASPNWTNLLKEFKSSDISGTPIDVVKKYLVSAGKVSFSLDPNDESTYAKAIKDCSDAVATLDGLLKPN